MSLAYDVVPGLIVPEQPSCTYITFYYNSPSDFASSTSSFLSPSSGGSNAFCDLSKTTISAIAETDSQANFGKETLAGV